MTEEHVSDKANADAGGRAHTGLDEEHPAGEGPRSDRDVGGPTSTDSEQGDVAGQEGRGHGDRPSGFDAHE
jgi:hypothetical protein